MEMKLKGIKITDLVLGEGATAETGKRVTIHYRGFLNHGEQFRSSYDLAEPASFRIGERKVIPGLEKGIIGMRVGGKRRLKVSPHLAYREDGAPGIPPNAVLILEVELIAVEN